MRIAFKFHYIHDNGLFTRLLNRLEELSEIPLTLYNEVNHYKIIVEGDQPTLEKLAEEISTLVPRSLFLLDSTIEAAEDEEEGSDTTLPQSSTSFQVPYCPECQSSVIKTLDSFTPCSVCGFSDLSLDMEMLSAHTGISAPQSSLFFQELADRLIEKGEVTLPTYNGVRTFSLLNAPKSDAGILVCDPSHISDKFLITQGELDALMMIEKPVVRLKPKLMFRAENELDKPFCSVFFADDKITLAFATVLKDRGIDAVQCDHTPTLRVASALEQYVIISSGRDMLPYRAELNLEHASFCRYADFDAYGDQKGLILAKKLDLKDRPHLSYVSKYQTNQVRNAIRFEPAHAAMRSVVLEHGLKEQSLSGIYLSKENPSHIFSFSSKIGYTPMVLFNDQDILQPMDMLEAIRTMNESGKRLIDNFIDKFPELFEKIIQTKFNTQSDISDIAKIWAMAAVFLGLYDGNDLSEGCEVLESTAIEFNGKSGPRIDYKVMSTEEGYQLDARLVIRSAMSFKLAGLDDYLLSFGFIDSLADFIAQQAENADANIGINGVALCGDLFENRQLLMRAYNALSVNYPVYRNQRLSIDNANVALGAITLGSE